MATASNTLINASSDSYCDDVCEPCSKLGNNCEAEKFCLDCQEYLCKRCFAYHMVLTQTQNHGIIGVEDKKDSGVIAKYVKSIETNRPNETDFWNSGLALLPNKRLAVADRQNRKLKVLDTGRGQLVSEIGLPAFPIDLTKTSSDTLAVTVPDKRRLLLVRTLPKLTLVGGFDVAGVCSGVSYNASKSWLAVSFTLPTKVEIMDLTGHVVRVIDKVGGQRPFRSPGYVTFSPDDQLLYVCEGGDRAGIVKLGLDGSALAIYDNPEDMLTLPSAIVTRRAGDIFIAGYGVFVLSSDCTNVQRLLENENDDIGMIYPQSLSFDDVEDLLYVGMYGRSQILVFKIK